MSRTFPDFYAFRARSDAQPVVDALRLAFGGRGHLLGHSLQETGWQGYAKHSLLNFAGKQVGLVAWGGQQQLGWVHASLSGAGCEFVESWDFFEAVVKALPEFSYRRVDLALDLKDGACTHERVVAAYRRGEFDHRGHRPDAQRIETEDRSAGWTVYVGNRRGWRFFRGYEKGKQLRGQLNMPGLTHVGEVRVEDWYRLEVEFKAKDGAVLPLDLVEARDHYFAGAYPFLASVMRDTDPEPIRIPRKHVVHTDLIGALASCKRTYGNALKAALHVYDGDVQAVWDQIVGEQITDRWIAAGAGIKVADL